MALDAGDEGPHMDIQKWVSDQVQAKGNVLVTLCIHWGPVHVDEQSNFKLLAPGKKAEDLLLPDPGKNRDGKAGLGHGKHPCILLQNVPQIILALEGSDPGLHGSFKAEKFLHRI